MLGCLRQEKEFLQGATMNESIQPVISMTKVIHSMTNMIRGIMIPHKGVGLEVVPVVTSGTVAPLDTLIISCL